MSNLVGIGIIGTGFARKVQIPGFLMSGGAKIVSIASGSYENARSTAEQFGVEHYTADWRETAARRDVDLVCITTPPDLHREMAMFALEQHKHVLCEKPMAMSVAEAEEMADFAARRDLLALIDHELRFLPGRQRAFAMLREGAIGTVRHAKYSFRASYRADGTMPWNWWSDAAQGGGALGAIGSHVVDSFNWLLGTRVASVYCRLQTAVKKRPGRDGEMGEVTADDAAMMVLEFADSELTTDATALVSVSTAEPPEYQNRIELFGTLGAMRIDQRGELFIGSNGEDDWQRVPVEYGRGIEGVYDSGFPSGFTEFAPRIVDAILSGARHIPHAATFKDGVEVQRVLDAARESNAAGARTPLSA
ncbi:MAG: Gfo/Idh/MocA family protein [Pyrinomonadaceae bacterium]